MKKLILITIMILSLQANAQFTIWEDDFNDGDISDWTILDIDGNTSNWIASKSLSIDPNTGQVSLAGVHDVLFTTNLDLGSQQLYPAKENNWAITPAQDLSYYAGTVQLKINAQPSEYSYNDEIYVYVSNSPDMASFLTMNPIKIDLPRNRDEGNEFKEHIVDISAYAGAGKTEVYFAIVCKSSPIGLEIDDVKITATGFLGLEDFRTNKLATLKQNPVTETLAFQLGEAVNTEALQVAIYNTTGVLVKQTTYNEAGITVSELAGGMYFAVLNDGKATERVKFIKK